MSTVYEHSRRINYQEKRYLAEQLAGTGSSLYLPSFRLHPTKKDTQGLHLTCQIPIYNLRNFRALKANVTFYDSTNTIWGSVKITNNLPDSGFNPTYDIWNDSTSYGKWTDNGKKEINMSFGSDSFAGLRNGANLTIQQEFIFNEYLWINDPSKDYLLLRMDISMDSSSKWNSSQDLTCDLTFMR